MLAEATLPLTPPPDPTFLTIPPSVHYRTGPNLALALTLTMRPEPQL